MSLVSIILTTLNSERYVARSIGSCLNQTHREVELLIVDGGSHDRTLDIVGQIDDPRVKVIHQLNNAGRLPGAINLGMAAARGEFLTWAQDDSWYEPNAIETMLNHLSAHADVALVYADYWDVDPDGRLERYQRVNPPDHILIDDVVRQCFLFRREVFTEIGPQDTRYFPVHEVPWRIKVAQRFKIQPLHLPLMYYTVHTESLTGRIGPWVLQRMFLPVLVQEGHFSAAECRRRLAQIDIDEAFDQFVLQGNYGRFWACFIRGIARDPGQSMNRGLWRLALASVSPHRHEFRKDLLDRWRARDSAAQHALILHLDRHVRHGQLAHFVSHSDSAHESVNRGSQ